MTTTNDACRAFASLALFRQLYSEKKNDIYGIVAEFVRSLIITKGIHEFSLPQITRELNKEFDFKLPEIIVKPALKRLDFISLSDKIYTAKKNVEAELTDIFQKQSTLIAENNEIITDLIEYVKNHIGRQLEDSEREKVKDTFCSYLMDDTDSHEYNEFVSAFIVDKSKDQEYKRKLNAIREGIILNTGIRYTPQMNEFTSWDNDLVVFLDTEIVFHIAGYNGEIFKQIAHDLLELINEVNSISVKKGKGKKISLSFFPIVGQEIEEYFSVAEKVVEGYNGYMSESTAMKIIVNGCKSAADVIQKREALFNLLRNKGITQSKEIKYEDNIEYNIESQELLDIIKHDIKLNYVSSNDLANSLRLLNFVNITRKGKSYSYFEDSRALLLTGKNLTMQVALHDKVKRNSIPLATTMNFMISRLWFKLNKGFGAEQTPKSFDILTKAQIVLSTQLNNSISIDYHKIQEQNKKGKISKEVAIATIIALRNKYRNPEDIVSENLDEILNDISEKDLDKYKDEVLFYKDEIEKKGNEVSKLQATISNLQDSLNSQFSILQAEKETLKREYTLMINEYKAQNKILNIQNGVIIKLLKQVSNELKDERTNREADKRKVRLVLIIIFLLIIIGVAIWLYFADYQLLSFVMGAVSLIAFFIGSFKKWWSKPIVVPEINIESIIESETPEQNTSDK